MRILGIDPGLANTGFGVIEHSGQSSRFLTCGCISTPSGDALAQRLSRIHDGLAAVIDEWKPDAACIEHLFFSANVRTAISVAQGRGVCILATAKASIPIFEYTPLQIKQAIVGYGRASKAQVQKMVKALLALQHLPATDHAADALAVALCHAHQRHFTQLVDAAVHRDQRPAQPKGT